MSVLGNLSKSVALRPKAAAITDDVQGPPVPLTSGRTEIVSLLQSNHNNASNQAEMYKRNGNLFAAAGFNAMAVAQTVWRLYQSRDGRGLIAGSDQRREVTAHQALRVWLRPNAFMTGAFFQEYFSLHIELTGLVYWVVVRNPLGIPIEMWPVTRDCVIPVQDREKFLRGYVYVGPLGETIPLQLDEVVPLQAVDPTDLLGGVAPAQPLMTDLEAGRLTSEWRRNFFKNSANPGGIIELDNDTNLSDDEFDELSDRWAEQHRGVRAAHRVAILERGTWKSNDQSLRDMQFVEMRQDDRDTIYEGYRVSKSLMGVTEDVNRANADANEYVFTKWNLKPKLNRIRDALNFQYLPMFSSAANGEYAFDFDEVVTADWQAEAGLMKERTKGALNLVQAGYDPEGVLAALGLPPIKFLGPPAALALPAVSPGGGPGPEAIPEDAEVDA